jgi:hypothetical protein
LLLYDRRIYQRSLAKKGIYFQQKAAVTYFCHSGWGGYFIQKRTEERTIATSATTKRATASYISGFEDDRRKGIDRSRQIPKIIKKIAQNLSRDPIKAKPFAKRFITTSLRKLGKLVRILYTKNGGLCQK